MKKLVIALLATAAFMLPHGVQAADLTIWALQAFNQKADDRITEMAQEFGRERGISVEYTIVPANVLNERLAAAIQGGALPDVFMQVSPQVQYYANLGVTMPLGDILAQMRSVEGGVYESTVSAVMYDGKALGIPLEVDVVPMFARKDLLQEVGMNLPTTLEELRAASKAILEKDPTITAFGHPTGTANDSETLTRMIVWSFGGAMFNPDGTQVTWNSAETVAGYQFIADMFAEGTIPRSTLSWDDAGNNTAYQTGRAAFIMNPPSVYQWMVDNDPDLLADTALIPIPRGPGEKGRSATMISSFAWMVSKDTKRPDDAKAWLTYFFEPKRYEEVINTVGGRWLPIYPALYTSMPLFKDNPDFAQLGEMAKNGVVDGYAGPPTAWASAVFNAKVVTQSIQRMLVDGESADAAVAWATAEIEKLKIK
ncbi:sugar ABC transporter substrate-binding protein [Mesorhizobium sp. BAC0120]|uniref:ABC transporter substrate-binding protein n=1 Tax=Mesorhizobium sp. BAC0120 TaxID=3090670 RepID=UPI00298D475B|nr:sugar ABC transporter substrate-binding protein [Mesorhizobium sp. BAC0120]MDW6022953.1 sugar ABC transporter substrate-binding protein [Mesorhizobium sp. BAC0120]